MATFNAGCQPHYRAVGPYLPYLVQDFYRSLGWRRKLRFAGWNAMGDEEAAAFLGRTLVTVVFHMRAMSPREKSGYRNL